MQYRFYLDGTLISEQPEGWSKMLLKVNRDRELKGVLSALDANLTFSADGYDYLKGLHDTSGYCDEVTISVHRSIDDGQNFIEHYVGLLHLSKMVFDEFKCSVLTRFTDNSFYGRINKRRTTPATLTGESTVNGVAIAACQIYPMQLFDPSTGTYGILDQSHGCYRVYDALEYLIKYMTDDECDFDSPLFSPSGDFPYLMLTFGFPIRALGNGNDLSLAEFIEFHPNITFQKLFTELDRRLNIGFYVDLSGPKPKIIIDYWKELFRNTTLTTFPDLPNLKTEIASEYIYSRIKLGGSKTLDAAAASFPETIRFVGFNSEEFAITGKCPEDTLLDLGYEYISSSNIIEQIYILSGTDDSYDKDWFLIDGRLNGSALAAEQSNWLTAGPPYYYNGRFINSEIAKRYIGFVPNAIAQYLGNADNSILAEHNVYQAIGSPAQTVRFNTTSPLPLHDVNGLWSVGGPTGDFYTVPNTGIYSVGVDMAVVSNNHVVHLLIVAELRDTTDTILISESTIYENFYYPANSTPPIIGSTLVVASATDIIKIKIYHSGNPFWSGSMIPANPRVFIDNIADGGGIYQSYDPADYPIVKSTFTTEIKQSQTDAIIANPMGLIDFYIKDTDVRQGWVDELTIDEFKGTISAAVLRARRFAEPFPPDVQQVHFIGSLEDNPFALDILDRFGNPTPGNFFINRVLFYEVGKVINVSIPATHMGAAADAPCIIISEEDATVTNVYNFNTLTAQLTIRAGFKYKVRSRYVMSGVGNTFFQAVPQIVAPTVAGGTGSATIGLILPASAADYTFLWSTGATTQGISAPAGDYTCQVTYVPGTFDTNVLTFFIQIPISETGE